MNLLTAIVLMGCAGYVLFVVFCILHRMDKRTPWLLAWRIVLTGALGVYGFLHGLVSLVGMQAPEWYQLAALVIIAAVFIFSPRIDTSPRHDRARLSRLR